MKAKRERDVAFWWVLIKFNAPLILNSGKDEKKVLIYCLLLFCVNTAWEVLEFHFCFLTHVIIFYVTLEFGAMKYIAKYVSLPQLSSVFTLMATRNYVQCRNGWSDRSARRCRRWRHHWQHRKRVLKVASTGLTAQRRWKRWRRFTCSSLLAPSAPTEPGMM